MVILCPDKNVGDFMKPFAVLVSVCFVLLLSGCNTMEGIGKDVGAAGDALEKSASDNKGY
jgi:entericidin B